MNEIYIIVKGGVVQEVFSGEKNVQITVLDEDMNGSSGDDEGDGVFNGELAKARKLNQVF